MARLLLEQVAKRWPGAEAPSLEDISFEVPDGEFWVLVGPSGCGKSTILRAIAGLEAPTSGNITIGDRVVTRIPARQRDVAMVFQNYALYPHMTVAENLGFGLAMRGVDAATRRDRVREVAQSLGLERLLQRKPSQLSGGQQQRVALGRAIARQPQVFLLDEPLSNLDAQLRDDTRAEIKLLHERLGITTIYVTHDQVEAMTLGDRIVVLDRGRIQQIGTPQEIYQQPHNLMVAAFFGNPAANILAATYSNGALRLGAQTLPCPPAWQTLLPAIGDRPFKLGIRPEHLHLLPEGATSELAVLQLLVRVVEPLGNRTLLRACLPESPEQIVQLEVPGTVAVPPHATIAVGVEIDRLMLFEPDTGKRLIFPPLAGRNGA